MKKYFWIAVCAIVALAGIKYFIAIENQSAVNADYKKGLSYANGEGGVTQDYAAAEKWFQKAAAKGSAPAQYALGVLYDQGHGVAQDYATAAKWYRLAADQGYAQAEYNLGLLYYNGNGVAQSTDEAKKWWLKAAAQGLPAAKNGLDLIPKQP